MIDTNILEEVLLAYLRSSKQVRLTDCKIEELTDTNKYTISFNVDKTFDSTLVQPLNQFFEFFKNEKQEKKR